MKYEFKTLEERNSFLEKAYKEGLRYTYHDSRKEEEGKYIVDVLE